MISILLASSSEQSWPSTCEPWELLDQEQGKAVVVQMTLKKWKSCLSSWKEMVRKGKYIQAMIGNVHN